MNMTQLQVAQALYHKPLYETLIQHLNNETMLQAIHVLDPEWKDTKFRIDLRTYKIAELMGLFD